MKIVKKMNLTKLFLIIFIYLFSSISCQQKRAKSIYVDIDVSNTSKKYDTYVLKFKTEHAPLATYWTLAKWDMDISEFIKEYPDAKSSGAYAGLHMQTNYEPKAFTSFFDIFYTENGVQKRKRAKRIYPPGEESTFDNEGEETNFFILQYFWNTFMWHRFVIHSWVDQNTNTTYVGEWIQNTYTEEWALLAYFDVGLQNSFLVNDLGFSQENFDSKYFGDEINFNLQSIYIFDHSYKKWISLNTSTIYSEKNENSQGTHEFGHSSSFISYIYGSSGLPVDDQELYDASMPENITGSIDQLEIPIFGDPLIRNIYTIGKGNMLTVSWDLDQRHTPCFSYNILFNKKIADGKYEKFEEYNVYRPEINSLDIVLYFKGEFEVEVVCNSILHTSHRLSVYKTF